MAYNQEVECLHLPTSNIQVTLRIWNLMNNYDR